MKKPFSLVLGTNIWTHHQVPLAQELYTQLGPDNFHMAIFNDVDAERRTMGWEASRSLPWVVGPPNKGCSMELLMRTCLDADVMVFGSCPDTILSARAQSGKLTLVQSERMLKKSFHTLRMINPRYAAGIRRFRATVDHQNMHALTIGHYAPDDLHRMRAFGDRMWKWGYFVSVPPEAPANGVDRPVRMMWAGRLLWWKHVDILLRAVARIKDEPWFGECAIIGDGEEKERLIGLARRLHLERGKVRFEPALPFQEVRARMRECDLYVLSSDRHEGWGAVAGEAMAEGAVLIANVAAGASHDLVVHEETGFLFADGDVAHLASTIARVASDYPLRMAVRQRAWKQMHTLWNPRMGAERLIALASGLLGQSALPHFASGPCSHSAAIHRIGDQKPRSMNNLHPRFLQLTG